MDPNLYRSHSGAHVQVDPLKTSSIEHDVESYLHFSFKFYVVTVLYLGLILNTVVRVRKKVCFSLRFLFVSPQTRWEICQYHKDACMHKMSQWSIKWAGLLSNSGVPGVAPPPGPAHLNKEASSYTCNQVKVI